MYSSTENQDNYAVLETYRRQANIKDGVLEIPSKVISQGIEYTVAGVRSNWVPENVKEIVVPEEFGNPNVKVNQTEFYDKVGSNNYFVIPDVEKVTIKAKNINIVSVRTTGKNSLQNYRVEEDYGMYKRLKEVSIQSDNIRISQYGLSGMPNLKKITFADSTNLSLDQNAIVECRALNKLTFPTKTKYQEGAITLCYDLRRITFRGNSEYKVKKGVVTKGKTILFVPSNVKSYTVNKEMKRIGRMAFANCSKLEKVTVNAREIGDYAFFRCKNLKKVVLKDTRKIGDCAFVLSNLRTVSIPKSLTELGDGVFFRNNYLTEIRSISKRFRVKKGCLISATGKELYAAIPQNGRMVVPQKVQSVLALSVTNPRKISSIEYPSSIQSVYPFGANLGNVKKIQFYGKKLPQAKVVSMLFEDTTFENVGEDGNAMEVRGGKRTKKLTVAMPISEKEATNRRYTEAFLRLIGTSRAIKFQQIKTGALLDETKQDEIYFHLEHATPQSDDYAVITGIGNMVKAQAGVVELPTKVTCQGIEYPVVGSVALQVPSSVKEVVVSKEFGSQNTEVHLSQSDEKVGSSNNFFVIPNVEKVTIKAKNINIINASYEDDGGHLETNHRRTDVPPFAPENDRIQEVSIQSENAQIAMYGLSGMPNLKTITFNQNQNLVLGENAIVDCTSLDNLQLPAQTEYCEGAISLCTRLNTVRFQEESKYTMKKGAIVKGNTLLFVPANVKTYTVDKSVKRVGNMAFANCANLKKAKVNAKEIGNYAFFRCKKLSSIKLVNTQQIGDCAFALSDLTCVTLPKSTKKIGYGVFFRNNNLKTIKCLSKSFKIKNGCLVSSSGKKLYAALSQKGKVSIPEKVEVVLGLPVTAPKKVTSLELPKSIKTIYQFGGILHKLKKVTFASARVPKGKELSTLFEDDTFTRVGYGMSMICVGGSHKRSITFVISQKMFKASGKKIPGSIVDVRVKKYIVAKK